MRQKVRHVGRILRHKVSDETSETARGTRVLQRTCQIVDARGASVLFAVGIQMNERQKMAGILKGMSGANSFRACLGGLVDPLLAAERVDGPFMIACIKTT